MGDAKGELQSEEVIRDSRMGYCILHEWSGLESPYIADDLNPILVFCYLLAQWSCSGYCDCDWLMGCTYHPVIQFQILKFNLISRKGIIVPV